MYAMDWPPHTRNCTCIRNDQTTPCHNSCVHSNQPVWQQQQTTYHTHMNDSRTDTNMTTKPTSHRRKGPAHVYKRWWPACSCDGVPTTQHALQGAESSKQLPPTLASHPARASKKPFKSCKYAARGPWTPALPIFLLLAAVDLRVDHCPGA